MSRYVLLRLALMPLTFALALVLIFAVVNLSPAGGGSDTGMSAEERASARVFREQFALDRPVLLSTRAWTGEAEVLALLERASSADLTERARAEQALEDLGPYASAPLSRLGDPRGARFVRAGPEPPRGPSTLLTDTRLWRFGENVLSLDFGRSLVDRAPVMPVILARLRVSVTLGLCSILLAYALAIPLGVYSAARAGGRLARAIDLCLFAMSAAPTFFVGSMLLELFAGGRPLSILPAGGFDALGGPPRTTLEIVRDVAPHLVLPVLTYTIATLAALSRYARAGAAEALVADHVRTARAKGLPELVVLARHVARNGMIPVLALLGGVLPAIVSGSVVIEVVFGIPGIGSYLYDAIGLRDYNAVMGVLVIVTAATIVGVFLSDLAVAMADPRVRLGARAES